MPAQPTDIRGIYIYILKSENKRLLLRLRSKLKENTEINSVVIILEPN
jgi:hypothetical protein